MADRDCPFFLIIVIGFGWRYMSNLQSIIEETEYIKTYETNLYLFKNIDYIELDNFSLDDLAFKQGTKVNGYSSLTKEPKVVSQTFLDYEIATIDEIITNKYYENWNVLVEEYQKTYTGLGVIGIKSDSTFSKGFLESAIQYYGMNLDKLNETKENFVAINDGEPRDITLKGLGLTATGYIYGRLNPMEKVISQNMLPYVNKDLLDLAESINKNEKNVLKIVNNKQLFASFIMPDDEVVHFENEALAEKNRIWDEESIQNNVDYYEHLTIHVDDLWTFPEMQFKFNEKIYTAYLVDMIFSDSEKIGILIIKDYINDFISENILKAELHTISYRAYEAPISAIKQVDGKSKMTLMERGYFPEDVDVLVDQKDKSKAILPVEDNPNIAPGMAYLIHP